MHCSIICNNTEIELPMGTIKNEYQKWHEENKIDVTPHDGDVLIKFLNVKVVSLVTQGRVWKAPLWLFQIYILFQLEGSNFPFNST